jgi:hypothetical protein
MHVSIRFILMLNSHLDDNSEPMLVSFNDSRNIRGKVIFLEYSQWQKFQQQVACKEKVQEGIKS